MFAGIRNTASQRFAWRTLGDLLPDNFRLSGVELHVENGDTVVDLRNGTLSGAQIEAGVFSAGEITIVSPWFRKSFSDLRGATSWQDNRLSIGALTLTRGLDLDAVSIDLSQIGESRLGSGAERGRVRRKNPRTGFQRRSRGQTNLGCGRGRRF